MRLRVAPRSSSGFTIVELLIVIVVIAILAAISISTFTGIQQRANNTARISDARKMKSLLEQHIAINGAASLSTIVPEGTGWDYYCIGEGYTDVITGVEEGCYFYQNGNNPPNTTNSLPALDSALKPLGDYSISALPSISYTASFIFGGNTYTYLEDYSGPYIHKLVPAETNVNGAPGFMLLSYTLEGNDVDCVLKPMAKFVNFAAGISYYSTNNSDRNDFYHDGVTWCTLHISAN